MPRDQLAEHVAKVRSDRQIATFVELFLLQSRPLAVNLATADRTAQHEHHAAVAMVGSVIAVLLRSPPELRHGNNNDILHAVAHVRAKGGQCAAELTEQAVQLAGLVLMMVPPANLGECGLYSSVRLDELCDLLQASAQLSALHILRAAGRIVRSAAERLEQPHCGKRILARRSERLV